MKVLTIVLIFGIAAVCAVPLESKSENENIELLENVEVEPSADVDFVNESVRDKRQYGGNCQSSFEVFWNIFERKRLNES